MSQQQVSPNENRNRIDFIFNNDIFPRDAEVEIGWVSTEEAEDENRLVPEPAPETEELDLLEEGEITDEEAEESDVQIPTPDRQEIEPDRQQQTLEQLVVEWVRLRMSEAASIEEMLGSSAPDDVEIVLDEGGMHEEEDGGEVAKAQKEFGRSLGN